MEIPLLEVAGRLVAVVPRVKTYISQAIPLVETGPFESYGLKCGMVGTRDKGIGTLYFSIRRRTFFKKH
jgi:hypothetical protein